MKLRTPKYTKCPNNHILYIGQNNKLADCPCSKNPNTLLIELNRTSTSEELDVTDSVMLLFYSINKDSSFYRNIDIDKRYNIKISVSSEYSDEKKNFEFVTMGLIEEAPKGKYTGKELIDLINK